MTERREELIERSLAYFLDHGLSGLSLRPLAAEIGTSARLLVYHFDSKDGLVSAVMDELRARIQASFQKFATQSDGSVITAFWSWIVQPANLKLVRLMYEVQILAIQNPAAYGRYTEATSSSWLQVIETTLPRNSESRTLATLCVAVIDGLVLEYLSTRDRKRTTDALEMFDRLIAAHQPRSAAQRGKRKPA